MGLKEMGSCTMPPFSGKVPEACLQVYFQSRGAPKKEWMATVPAHIMRVPALQCNIRAFKAMNPPSVVNRPSQGKLEDSISRGIHKIRKHFPSLLLSTVS